MHDHVRDVVVSTLQRPERVGPASAVHNGSGDTLYPIDQVAEAALVDGLAAELAAHEPIVVIGEGLPDGRITLPSSADSADARWRVIVDPIDGTRPLIYQKRPGWILTAVAPNRGEATSLADIELAVQTEIPLVKQHLCDQLSAVRGQGAHAVRINRLTNDSHALAMHA